MRLYHGSIVEVHKPSLRYGRERTDFGRGFYTTTLAEQAERWANIKKDRAKADKAIVSVYEIDDAVLYDPTLKIREFHGVDEAWLDFVVGCRKEGATKHDFDLVFGPVANDNVFTTVNLYESGILDAAPSQEEIQLAQQQAQNDAQILAQNQQMYESNPVQYETDNVMETRSPDEIDDVISTLNTEGQSNVEEQEAITDSPRPEALDMMSQEGAMNPAGMPGMTAESGAEYANPNAMLG